MNKRSVTIFTKPELYDGMTMITILCDSVSDAGWPTVKRDGEVVATFDGNSILGWVISEANGDATGFAKNDNCRWRHGETE